MGDEEGFYFFPDRIGYNGIGYSNALYNRGYVVRWDYITKNWVICRSTMRKTI